MEQSQIANIIESRPCMKCGEESYRDCLCIKHYFLGEEISNDLQEEDAWNKFSQENHIKFEDMK
jgi:hypothetical protein